MRILLVEDNADIAAALQDLLEANNHQVVLAGSLNAALDAFDVAPFDLLVLDVMLPEGDDAGFEFASSVREGGFDGSILFLTARGTEADVVRGLDGGGDDYLVKPFGLAEFGARVRALLRRPPQLTSAVFDRGRLHMDKGAFRVSWDGDEVGLTAREFAILELFATYPDRVFPVEELRDRFFPEAESGPRVVRVYVSQLRHKLADELITTTPGGYRLGVEL